MTDNSYLRYDTGYRPIAEGIFRLRWTVATGVEASIDLHFNQSDIGGGWPPYMIPLDDENEVGYDILEEVRDAIAAHASTTVTVEHLFLDQNSSAIDWQNRVYVDPLGNGSSGNGS